MVKEQKILKAARKIFLSKGFDGARMQEIADEAEINNALLYYYFRSKDKLFEQVIEDVLNEFFPVIFEGVLSNQTMENRLQFFFENYIEFIQKNPLLPRFILNEVAKKPELIKEFLSIPRQYDALKKFAYVIQESVEKGEIRPITIHDFLLNLISLSVFPTLAKPIMAEFIGLSHAEYDQLLESRKKSLTVFFINGLK